MDGLEDLQCLMELYLGNNLISDMKETIKLKDLQRLIILDISGNLMSSQFGNNYRIYCINLRGSRANRHEVLLRHADAGSARCAAESRD